MKPKTKKDSSRNSDLPKLQVLCVDDHPVIRQSLCALLNREADIGVCWEGGDAPKALQAIGELAPDLVIVDISLPGSDGLELIKNIRFRYHKVPILVYSMYPEAVYAERAIRAGAKGYIMKEEAPAQLLLAIRRVGRGELYMSASLQERMLSQAMGANGHGNACPIDALTDRELEVFRMLGHGRGTRDIAQELRLSVKTVEAYRAKIMEKLEVKKAHRLVMEAYEWAHRAYTNEGVGMSTTVAHP